MACVGTALAVTYAAAGILLPSSEALAATVLVSANYYLMGRGSFYNHNTVMLAFVAGSVWATLRICRDHLEDRTTAAGIWLALGAALALGSLAKYQMAVSGLASAAALAYAGVWRRPGNRLRMLAALLLAAALVAPHVWWLWRNDFPSFTYAGHSLLADQSPGQRLHTVAAFVIQQIGRLVPAIVLIALCALIPRPEDQQARREPVMPLRRALAILALVPPLFVILLGLAGGVALQNHWGATTFLLLPLWLAVRLSDAGRLRRRWLMGAAVVQQCAAAIWFVRTAARSEEFHFDFPVDEIAQQARDYWVRRCGKPPSIIAGPDWEAGALALAMHPHPDVIPGGDRRIAPQASDDAIAAQGVLLLWRPEDGPGPVASRLSGQPVRDASWLRAVGTHGHLWTLGIGALDPVAGCGAP